jgi:hypothetical protein
MKTMLFAAATVLSLGVGSAYANESGGQSGGYVYPDYHFPAQSAPSVATAPNGQAAHAYVANSNHGTWVFPPDQNGDGTNG